MLSKILMPSGGQTTDEMLIQKWNKHVGDTVKRGDILFEIETDKAILTVESFAEGVLLEVRFPEGVMVKVGEVVALIGNPGDLDQEKKENQKQKQEEKVDRKEKRDAVVNKELVAETDTPARFNGSKKILASPLAKSLAKIEKIDLEKVARFVSGNLIKKADISRYLREQTKAPVETEIESDHYFIDNSQIRKTIAKRMRESLNTAPHYVISVDVDMTAAIALRNKLNKNGLSKQGLKVSFNDLLMKVVAKAVESAPLVNASFSENKLKVFRNVNIGLAVATETGIIVPVVHNVNKKSIAEITADSSRSIARVKNNQLTESELQGGTITISNLGMFGIDRFTAIINQPESCILAVGGISKKPVVVNDAVVIRDIMNITASFDHRIIDGAVGAPFLQKVRELLEDPELLLY
ncbi:dihydrolipoamide acetyltransferase family protein [Pollutibacter soli]|uniref:dihydrolipoamide acetyltransferase family protein n=1 Tax=Pollutibacter soli TaxID=3034157 RepID=UPI003013D432